MCSLTHRVEKPQFEREDDPVGDLDVPVDLLHVLEPLQVEGQDCRQSLHPHPFLKVYRSIQCRSVKFYFKCNNSPPISSSDGKKIQPIVGLNRGLLNYPGLNHCPQVAFS